MPLFQNAFAKIVESEPVLASPVSQACTQSQFDEGCYARWCAEIREPPRPHRKQWEFCYILQVLHARGMLAPGRRGLGFAVGQEPLTAVFAKYGALVMATDLNVSDARDRGWIAGGQHAAGLEALNARGICQPEDFAARVKFQDADMSKIPDHFVGFDFCWSACALEHLGSLRAGLDFIERSLRTLRPGGVAVHTTEYNVVSDTNTVERGGTVIYRRRDLMGLARRLAFRGSRLTMNFNMGSGELDQHIDLAPYSDDVHLKLMLAGCVTTSYGLIVEKSRR